MHVIFFILIFCCWVWCALVDGCSEESVNGDVGDHLARGQGAIWEEREGGPGQVTINTTTITDITRFADSVYVLTVFVYLYHFLLYRYERELLAYNAAKQAYIAAQGSNGTSSGSAKKKKAKVDKADKTSA